MVLHGSVPFRLYKVPSPPQLPREAVSKKKDSSFPFSLSRVSSPTGVLRTVFSRNSFGSRIYLVRRDTEGLNPHPANLVGSQGSPRVSLPVWFPPHSTLSFSLLFLLLFLLFLSAFFTPASTHSLVAPHQISAGAQSFCLSPFSKTKGKKNTDPKKTPIN